MSWRCLSSSFSEYVFKTFSRRLEDVLKTFLQEVLKTFWKRFQEVFQDVLKTSSRRLQDTVKKSCKNVFKASSGRLQDVLQRYLEDVFKTYHQVKCDVKKVTHQVKLIILLTRLWDLFNTFLRRTAKTIIYRGICLGHTSEKFMVGEQNLQEW